MEQQHICRIVSATVVISTKCIFSRLLTDHFMLTRSPVFHHRGNFCYHCINWTRAWIVNSIYWFIWDVIGDAGWDDRHDISQHQHKSVADLVGEFIRNSVRSWHSLAQFVMFIRITISLLNVCFGATESPHNCHQNSNGVDWPSRSGSSIFICLYDSVRFSALQ